MPAPKKLSHIVFRTSRLDDMIEWYQSVTCSTIAFRSPRACFMGFDEEHHRLGFIAAPNLGEQSEDRAGLEHVGFTFTTMDDLLDAYVEQRDRGIVPFTCTNHGPTTSLYYKDPDGNHVELLYDNFSTPEDSQRFMRSEAFQSNPMGLSFDPEQLLRCAKAGVPVERLTAYEALP
jgi:catechol-2,3-dioxygenase